MRFSTFSTISLLVTGTIAAPNTDDVLRARSIDVPKVHSDVAPRGRSVVAPRSRSDVARKARSDMVLKVRADGVVGNTDKICFFGGCFGGNSPTADGGPKCKIEQCAGSQLAAAVGCAQAAINPKKLWNDAWCAAGLAALTLNMPQACKDCLGKLVHPGR